ncbi:flagellar hook-basal body complex protein FliE [Colidextribacter sp. OB.20]|uniref:flagellar hook-basal body complex protein FliE n=1 Tax=Colidextribacter sp. OB.20 TaxID=2304568 RepID=UPI00136ED938|nr:flagellar hook-basal body complex protein FliE [Colidextribacter sp. OB.20]NBI10023.1 flagellar hook-basal body complex protein FliE [Colidextribacter sp. OB.20]
MEFTPIQPIRPLWDSLSQPVQTAGQDPAGSLFASVFQKAIQNVRDTNAEQVQLEYQLATGQIDNPALVTTAITKATTAAELLMQMRNHAVDTYNELMRISL